MARGTFTVSGRGWVLALGLGGLLSGLTGCSPAEEVAPPAVESQAQRLAAPIGQRISLKACSTQKFVSADQNLTNTALVADRATVQDWEEFQVVDAGGGLIALRAVYSDRYVSADTNLGGQLVANRTSIQDWEKFEWVDLGNNSIALKARSNGLFVSADLDRGASGPLYADRTSADCWESFTVTILGGGGGWVELWRDDFDGTSVNPANWTAITDIHVNSEQQQYTTSPQNIQVSNGTLKLIARNEWNNGYPFTSGRLESAGLREFGHGKVEARIKMPVGPGLWPAFWMLGNNIGQVGWPACGELDIMENVGYADWTSGALHGPGYSGNTPINQRFYPASPVSNWHIYATEFSSQDIKWFIDGVLLKTVTRAEVERYGQWVYDRPFFIILNLAVGGTYPNGTNGATTPYFGVPQSTLDLIRNTPQALEVDWVRFSQWQ
ncbi:family 16 glycosylhydrolase [Myxococcus sp. RHSTA-1-4]|uniref:family 16 glycosylhydrolase n=1 Tax=Myxococcus sp. RHSTA-1-4 TaxID=2874601 RepID=UPI001CBFB95E|nr:family 16 glycosylhydrolase [Myxococcus sp. RHSTA-1-4]MBZ4415358.1 family 16 glycosylhydrolase [Myxococcus sp. RHSTA-1-4]